MMEMMYSIDSLQLQANSKNHQFILAKENGVTLGFASFELNLGETKKTKIHKIYILSRKSILRMLNYLRYILNIIYLKIFSL